MIFKILTAIVFISELVITSFIISILVKTDKKIKKTDNFIKEAKPKIQTISELISGISEQIAELTPIWVEKFKKIRNKIILNQFESIMSGIIFYSINMKIIKKLRKSKLFKLVFKGLSLLQNMI